MRCSFIFVYDEERMGAVGPAAQKTSLSQFEEAECGAVTGKAAGRPAAVSGRKLQAVGQFACCARVSRRRRRRPGVKRTIIHQARVSRPVALRRGGRKSAGQRTRLWFGCAGGGHGHHPCAPRSSRPCCGGLRTFPNTQLYGEDLAPKRRCRKSQGGFLTGPIEHPTRLSSVAHIVFLFLKRLIINQN